MTVRTPSTNMPHQRKRYQPGKAHPLFKAYRQRIYAGLGMASARINLMRPCQFKDFIFWYSSSVCVAGGRCMTWTRSVFRSDSVERSSSTVCGTGESNNSIACDKAAETAEPHAKVR